MCIKLLEMMKEVVGPSPFALTDRICTSNLIIETFSQLVFYTFIFKNEQFAKSIALGMMDGEAV